MNFEESINNSIQKTTDWLSENEWTTKNGKITHSIFFSSEKESENALEYLIKSDYREAYRDTLQDGDHRYWIDFAKEISMNKYSIESEVSAIIAALKNYDFDYNSFTVLVDLDDEDENTEFFDPNE